MYILIFIAVTIAVLLAAAVLFFRPYDSGADPKPAAKMAPAEPDRDSDDATRWRSARIRPGLNFCSTAASLSQEVFLACALPPLPLECCSEPDCTCHYLFLDDRRSGVDRRASLGDSGKLLPRIERRRSAGRRLTDLAA